MTAKLSRRRVLAGAAGLGAAGVTYSAVGLSPVRAQVSADGLTVADAQYDAPGGDIYSPRLDVEAVYQFEGVDQAAQVMVACLIDGGILDTQTADAASGADSGRLSVGGVLVNSRTVDSQMWNATAAGGEVSHAVDVELRLEVRAADGSTLASAKSRDTAQITVTDAGPTLSASVGGSGDVSFVPTEGGTPTG